MAIAVPNMADLVAVIGAFAISFLSFVLPPLVYYQLCGPELGQSERTAVVAFFFTSLGIMGYTTYAAMATLISHL